MRVHETFDFRIHLASYFPLAPFLLMRRLCLRPSRQLYRSPLGGLGSMFQPDYAGEGIAQTSPNRLYGVGAYVDARFSRWVQIEGEGRWLRYNEYLGIN